MKALAIVLGCSLTTSAVAQRASAPTPTIPIRRVAPPDAKTREPLKLVSGLVQFDDGRVLVNDAGGRRLLLFDRTLSNYKVTADTSGAGATAYPPSSATGGLFHYLGDSAAFADMSALAFVVIGPDGALGRAMAHPRPQDLRSLSQPLSGSPTFDVRGRFVYRAFGPSRLQSDTAKRTLDTASVVRADFDARRIDTVVKIMLPTLPPRPEIFKDDNGKTVSLRVVNLVPPSPDEWAVISDGSIAVVRSHDYHIDWVYADGTAASTPKMPFDWRRLTDADKQAKIDSARRIIDSITATGRLYQPSTYSCSPGPRGESTEVWGQRCLAERASGKSKIDSVGTTVVFAPLNEMLDYVPAIRPFALKADRDNHLWILPSTTLSAVGGGLLYDVVNTQGEIVERVQLPAGRSIVGFGPDGVIYLQSGDRAAGFVLERTHVVRSGQ